MCSYFSIYFKNPLFINTKILSHLFRWYQSPKKLKQKQKIQKLKIQSQKMNYKNMLPFYVINRLLCTCYIHAIWKGFEFVLYFIIDYGVKVFLVTAGSRIFSFFCTTKRTCMPTISWILSFYLVHIRMCLFFGLVCHFDCLSLFCVIFFTEWSVRCSLL